MENNENKFETIELEELGLEMEKEIKTEEKVDNKNEQQIEPESKSSYIQIIQLIKLILSSNNDFNKILSQAKISVSQSQSVQIKNILKYLISNNSNKSNKSTPIDMIVSEVLEILSDNKIELYEIPSLINIIHESLKNLHSIKITTQDVGILIKLILFILIETKIIHVKTQDYELVFFIIDSSMILLNKSVKIKIPKLSKCFCL